MIPYTVEIVGRKEPIDAVKIAYGFNKKDGKRYVYIVTIDGRIASFDAECPSYILWENEPTEEDLRTVDRLILEAGIEPRKEKEQEVQYQ